MSLYYSTHISLVRNPFLIYGKNIKGCVFQKTSDGVQVARLVFEKAPDSPGVDLPNDYQFQLDDVAAQELMDNLWQVGIRPTEGAGSAGQLAAVERHLDDTRKLVDKLLPLALREPKR